MGVRYHILLFLACVIASVTVVLFSPAMWKDTEMLVTCLALPIAFYPGIGFVVDTTVETLRTGRFESNKGIIERESDPTGYWAQVIFFTPVMGLLLTVGLGVPILLGLVFFYRWVAGIG
jgi:hypothetical protein